jgi:hypothetical protein
MAPKASDIFRFRKWLLIDEAEYDDLREAIENALINAGHFKNGQPKRTPEWLRMNETTREVMDQDRFKEIAKYVGLETDEYRSDRWGAPNKLNSFVGLIIDEHFRQGTRVREVVRMNKHKPATWRKMAEKNDLPEDPKAERRAKIEAMPQTVPRERIVTAPRPFLEPIQPARRISQHLPIQSIVTSSSISSKRKPGTLRRGINPTIHAFADQVEDMDQDDTIHTIKYHDYDSVAGPWNEQRYNIELRMV